MADSYHHGNLRRAVLDSAAEIIAQQGPASLSLREVARRAGVSHGAPAHHFHDRRGMFTALACEGFERLAAAMEAPTSAGDFAAVAQAYVAFALTNPGHYAVMFRRDLVDNADPDLVAARRRTGELLATGLAGMEAGLVTAEPRVARLAAWSLVHGFASLWLSNAIEDRDRLDPIQLTREMGEQLFGDIPSAQ